MADLLPSSLGQKARRACKVHDALHDRPHTEMARMRSEGMARVANCDQTSCPRVAGCDTGRIGSHQEGMGKPADGPTAMSHRLACGMPMGHLLSECK
jgi:hypothetical protein